MKYTEKDLYKGMKLRYNDEVNVSWWTTGKLYKVIKSVSKLDVDKLGPYYIYDNDGDKRDTYSTILNGLNDKKAPVTFEIVEEEKEVPTLKEAIQAKIEQLRTDAEIISNKRNRMEWQMFNLNSKANKLEEVLETIKEFE